jgi:hypothetical protein
MGLSVIKREARLAIQGAMGEPCTYSDGEHPTVPTLAHQAAGLGLTARFHTKSKVQMGDNDGLSLMEPIEKVVFNRTELLALDLELEQGSEVYWPGYGITVVLDSPLDPDGPENVYWTCTRA